MMTFTCTQIFQHIIFSQKYVIEKEQLITHRSNLLQIFYGAMLYRAKPVKALRLFKIFPHVQPRLPFWGLASHLMTLNLRVTLFQYAY
ncbi:MAG: hypothetical protein UF218_01760 [Eggerthellaceae bacterium]|nr:hypothetical protein [Eggerthellaceae bacterium]